MSASVTETVHVRVPEKPRVQGPLMTRRMARTVAGLLTLIVLGILPALLDASPAWRAFGLGLVWPGGGFLYTGDPLLTVLTLVVFVVSLFFFFFRADHVLPAAVWLAAAIGAAVRAGSGDWTWATWAVPGVLLAFMCSVAVRGRVRLHRGRKIARARNQYLADVRVTDAPVPTVAPEMSPAELATQRGLLDLALQPVDEWVGFDVVNQYGMGGFRYQCNFTMWSLGLGQLVHTPAFQGYINLAQRNLIEKATERKAWEFWRRENLLGNLDPNPDPIRRENIMYSGYLLLMLEVYASNTGDLRYEQPGSLQLRWNDKRVFSYDAGSIADAMLANYERRGEWGMFACEPGILFPGCNAIGLSALTIRDRRRGTDVAERLLPLFRRTLDQEVTTADGSIAPNVYVRYGFSNTLVFALAAEAGHGLWLHPLAPDVTTRIHEVVRREYVSFDGDRVLLGRNGVASRYDTRDPGNAAKSPLFLYAMVGALAREMGDDELFDAIRRRAEEECGLTEHDGRRWFPANSVFGNACWAMAMLDRAGGWYDVVRRGMPEHWRSGPALVGADYPDVLVARASTDGQALDLVLRPGAGGGRQRLGIERLVPGRSYRVLGALDDQVVADERGCVEITVDLPDRVEVQVLPTA